MSNFGQRIEAPAMSVAGEVIQLLQFTKDGEIGGCAENALQLGQIGDLVTAKMLAQHGGLERSRSHNVIVHTPRGGDCDNYNIMKERDSGRGESQSCPYLWMFSAN